MSAQSGVDLGELVELLPEEYSRSASLVGFHLVTVPKAWGNRLLKLLQARCPLGLELIHLKRARAVPSEPGAGPSALLEVLVCLESVEPPSEVLALLNELGSTEASWRVAQVPHRGALTRAQLSEFSQYWPLTFRKPSLEPLELPDNEVRRYERLLAQAQEVGDAAGGRCGCVIIDRDGRLLAAVADASTPQRPLRHSVMLAIESIAATRVKAISGQGVKRPHVDDDHLCCDCEVITTHEPCVMCSMALVHSRVRTVVYQKPDVDFGGLGGKLSLHTCASLNHQFRVLTWRTGLPKQVSGDDAPT